MEYKLPGQDIVDAHSTPSLKRGELTRSAKRQMLIESYKLMSKDEREALLDTLYGPEN